MKPLAICLSSLSVLAISMGVAGAASAQSVRIEGAVARVVVIPEARSDVGVEIIPGRAELPALKVERRGDRVLIDGGLVQGRGNFRALRVNRCERGSATQRRPGEGAFVEVRGMGRINLEDAPLVVLRTPRKVDVDASGGVFGSVGPGAETLDLASAGCGLWTVGNVEGRADLAVAGSGGVRIGNTQRLNISIGGSGDVRAQQTGSLTASIGGSGDVKVRRVNGAAEIQVGGSGDVHIEGGRIDKLDVAIAGSGDIRIDATVADMDAAIAGSGDIRVERVTGRISRSVIGSGRVHIGN